MNITNALVIGGGIGGMATALRLTQKGVAVEIVDIDPDWRVYGAGITITGPTLRAFKRLGLLDQVGRAGAFVDGSKISLFNGIVLSEQVDHPVEPGLPTVGGIMRPALHALMARAVRDAGIVVRLGLTVQKIEDQPDHVDVVFSDGSARQYDLVVGADGINSATRAMLFPAAIAPRYTGQSSWRIVVDRPGGMDKTQFYVGHANMVGMVAVSETKAYIFVLNPDSEKRRIEPKDHVKVLRELLADFGGDIATARDALNDNTQIVYRPLEAALQPRPWNLGRIVLIGDAVHATTPHLASGAGSAVEDAMVLVDELDRPGQTVQQSLDAYTERRYERCRFVVETSIAIGDHQLRRGDPQELGPMMGGAFKMLAAEY